MWFAAWWDNNCQIRWWRIGITTQNAFLTVAKKELFSGRFAQAHAAAQQALRADPRAFEAVLVMAAIALEHDNLAGAKKLCDVLGKEGFESGWLSVLRGRIALQSQDQEVARAEARDALGHGCDDPHVANQLGVLLSRTGAHAQAVAPLRFACSEVTDNPDYRYNLAVALQFAGDLTHAEEAFGKLVEIKPDHASGWLALVQLAKEPKPGWQPILEQQFEHTSDADQRLLFGHALARLAEGEKAWDQSFDWLRRAKAAKAGEIAHDREEVEALIDSALAAAASCDASDLPEDNDQRPIFIVGMPRSGTTLVERIVTSHSAVVSLGELSDFSILLKQEMDVPGRKVLDSAVLSRAAGAQSLGQVGEHYLRRTGALAGDAARFVDKMPFNVFFAPAILRALPGARIVCLRRSPFDVLFANFRQLFATGFSYYSYGYDFADTAHFVAQFERLALGLEKALPPSRFHAITYEGIIADQRGETERLLEFCGLEWEEACMDFHRNAEPVATASSVQVRKPLYSSSIDQWKRYGEASAMARTEFARYGIEPH